MKYNCGAEVMLGDEILVQHGSGQESLARVVAIGQDLVVDDIDDSYYTWAKKEGLIDQGTVVVDWVQTNPLSHDEPNFAPVGDYMILESLCCEKFIKRST
jgi:hypothetical protein